MDEVVVNNVTYCGYGYNSYGGTGLRRIEISRAVSCGWLTLSDIERENFIFHEIGHAFFNRGHDDMMLCDGSLAFPNDGWAGLFKSLYRTWRQTGLLYPGVN